MIKRRAGLSETSRKGSMIAAGLGCPNKQLLGMQAPIMATVRTGVPGKPEVSSLQQSKEPASAQPDISGSWRHCPGKILAKGGYLEEPRKEREFT